MDRKRSRIDVHLARQDGLGYMNDLESCCDRICEPRIKLVNPTSYTVTDENFSIYL